MPDRSSRDGRTAESTSDGSSTDETASPATEEAGSASSVDGAGSASGVDEAVQRRLREAYLNDEESVLVVTGVRSAGNAVVVEMEPPHGGATHVERFPAPSRGSLSESEAFLQFLTVAGVSPLDVDGLIGERIPATYDADEGWQIDDASLRERDVGSNLPADSDAPADSNAPADSDAQSRVTRLLHWFETYRYWLLAGALIVGELAFVAVIILIYA